MPVTSGELMEGFISLAEEPMRANDTGMEEKMRYPTLYVNGEQLKGAVIGEKGRAEVTYEITTSGLKVYGIKFGKGTVEEPKPKKKIIHSDYGFGGGPGTQPTENQ